MYDEDWESIVTADLMEEKVRGLPGLHSDALKVKTNISKTLSTK